MQHQHELLLLLIVGITGSMASAIINSYGTKAYLMGDVEILINATYWKCDHLICPSDTYRCHVSKEKNSDTNVVRFNACYSKDDQVLLEKTSNDAVQAYERIALDVNAYRHGITSTVESGSAYSATSTQWNDDGSGDLPDWQDFEDKFHINLDHLERIGQDVEENVRKINENVERQMQQFNQDFLSNFNGILFP